MSGLLKLRAEDVEDLAVIAACLQDARTTIKEMVFDPDSARFMAAVVRYRRERLANPASDEGLTECPAILVFDDIVAVRYRDLDQESDDAELELLTIATEPGREQVIHVNLLFGDGAIIQLRTDVIRCRLNEVDGPSAAARSPADHFAAGDAGADDAA